MQFEPKARVPVLYVEDEEGDAFLMEEAFKRNSIPNPLKIARDGQKAIDYLTGHGLYADRKEYPLPRLILLDLNLPRKTGFDVLAWVKNNPRLAMLLVIFTSSDAVEDIDRAYKMGAHGYLIKPGGLNKLVRTVQVLRDYWLGINELPPNLSP